MVEPAPANVDQHAAWNGESAQRWTADPDRRDRFLAPVADLLFAAAALAPGERVRDVGCGCGATSLAAAAAVAPGGAVCGLDISEPMLAVAVRRATGAGVANVQFEPGDAQAHPLPDASFDVAISRFGTMFFADPVAAFANVGRALRPAGRLCIATWQPLAVNDWLGVPRAALLRYGSVPAATDGPGPFSQADPDVVAETLTAAGYEAVDPAPVQLVLTAGADVDEAVAYLTDTAMAQSVLDSIPEADRAAALDAVGRELAHHQTPQGVQLGGAVWIITGRRPG